LLDACRDIPPLCGSSGRRRHSGRLCGQARASGAGPRRAEQPVRVRAGEAAGDAWAGDQYAVPLRAERRPGGRGSATGAVRPWLAAVRELPRQAGAGEPIERHVTGPQDATEIRTRSRAGPSRRRGRGASRASFR
jgi:hypothetical protein